MRIEKGYHRKWELDHPTDDMISSGDSLMYMPNKKDIMPIFGTMTAIQTKIGVSGTLSVQVRGRVTSFLISSRICVRIDGYFDQDLVRRLAAHHDAGVWSRGFCDKTSPNMEF